MSILKPSTTGLSIHSDANKYVSVNANTSTPNVDIAGTVSHLNGEDGTFAYNLIDAFGSNGGIILRRANGTSSAKTAVLAGNALGTLATRGYGATTYSSGSRTNVIFRAVSNWSDTDQGSSVEFSLTPRGTATIATTFKINDIGIMSSVAWASVASATSITPTGSVFHVTGTTAIATIVAPLDCLQMAQITIIPDGAFTWTTAGNIALAGTAVVSKAITFIYDSVAVKWYPSYT